MKINVGLIEDEIDISKGIQELINKSEGFCCNFVFATADEAIKQIPKLDLDVVLTDIHLSGKSGIDCILALKPICPNIQFLICTSFEDSDTVFKALKAGASGYIVKTTKPSVLLDSIADVYRGGSPMSSNIARKVVQSFHQQEQINELQKLSPREKEILELLSKGLRYKQIADVSFISSETVRTHIYNIYQKLQVNSKMEAINKVFGNSRNKN
jgi:DNA-binding NarL/FixJ family response regulator